VINSAISQQCREVLFVHLRGEHRPCSHCVNRQRCSAYTNTMACISRQDWVLSASGTSCFWCCCQSMVLEDRTNWGERRL